MHRNHFVRGLRRNALVVALGLMANGGIHAQSTTGSISGSAPAGATITISNNSGLSRTVTADAQSRYNAGSLPVGTYTVQSGENRREVLVTVGASANASFGGSGDATTLNTVTVNGASIASIDTSTVDTRSVLTAKQIERLPLARSAESIALLAPGAISGAAGFFGNLVSFGGSGVSENAYYVNGYFTGEPLSNLGGFTLPHGAIEQQETFIGGYSAKYGRSDGGVINQIGKRGTNDWHFGAQVTWTPKSLRGRNGDLYLPDMDFSAVNANPNLPHTCGVDQDELCQYGYNTPADAGHLYSRGKRDNRWEHTYSVYAGGPLVENRLFIYTAAEWKDEDRTWADDYLTAAGAGRTTHLATRTPKLYAKLDWTITDNHFLEATYLGQKVDQSGVFNAYDFANDAVGARLSEAAPNTFWQKNQYAILKYTGYLTDNLTASATYGTARMQTRDTPFMTGSAFISRAYNQNPALNGGTPISNDQADYLGRNGVNRSRGLRADLEWLVGDHAITVGVDNIKFEAEDEGDTQVADYWRYGKQVGDISPGHVGDPSSAGNPQGYYVYRLKYQTATSMSLDQKAWYIEDRWQVTDNVLLKMGVRNDQFTNLNNTGAKYLDARNQWAPRLGFAWDVNGNGSFKVFGNAGRYFLAMPNNVAIRGASSSTYTREYFTYSGIDASGAPTGLTPVPRTDGGSGPFSSNLEYGQPIDVLAFAPKDLKNMFQDEYILGLEKMLSESWMLGVKLTRRDLKSAIDDVCDPAVMSAALVKKGIDPNTLDIPGCLMFNPGGKNTFSLRKLDGSGRTEFVMDSRDDWGFTDGMKRGYTGMDVYLERQFDGKWEARIDYTYSRSKGNLEGQVKSDNGQDNISKTSDWDSASLMQYAYGYLPNDRRHQLKVRGSYQINDEWMLGANFRINSGSPFSCSGFFNPGNVDEGTAAADPVGYGQSIYHTCFGAVANPGSARNPWNRTLDLGVTYRPAMLDGKLTLGMQVRNVMDANEVLQANVQSETGAYTVSNTYMLPQGRQEPRTVVFTAAYDW